MKKLLPVSRRAASLAALPMVWLKTGLFLVSYLLLAAPGFAQDVLWGMTRYMGSGGGGTAFSVATTGDDFTVRKAFIDAPLMPFGSLVEARDGYFYGVSQYQHGVSYYYSTAFGSVFKMSPAGDMTVLKIFNYSNGAYPVGDLVQGRDGNLYGMTSLGGMGGGGTVYKISPTGAFIVLNSFNFANGADPRGSLVEGSDGNFYGMTSSGGSNGAGTVFKITPTGTLTVLKNFGYADGSYPVGSLVQGRDGNFYGMTSTGGGSDQGTVFKISPAGTFTRLKDLGPADGGYPQGSLVEGRDGDFYGMTRQGGQYNFGTIFKIGPAGAFTVLKEFGSDYTDGYTAMGNLVQGRDGNFYGMTSMGGQTGYGTVFRMSPAGTVTILRDLSEDFEGSYPQGSLVEGSDGDFYGMTHMGGRSMYKRFGTVFKISLSGTVTILNDFDYSDGSYPDGRLMKGRDGSFYGVTQQGGSLNLGTFFKISPAGKHTVLKNLDYATGNLYRFVFGPEGSMVEGRDGNFYGMMQQGGYNNRGTFLKISPAGTHTVLKHFDFTDVVYTYTVGSLAEGPDGDFYGVTQRGGSSDLGTIFKISPAGTLTVLKEFTAAEGHEPLGGLVLGADGDFYGTASRGGSYGAGMVFKISSTGAFAVLKEFTVEDGAEPVGGLTLGNDGDFYGITTWGGSGYAGTFFKISPAGTFTVLSAINQYDLYDFRGSLVEGSDGDFYGIAGMGGPTGYGAIYKLSPVTGLRTIVRYFTEADGGSPTGGLVIEKQECTPPVLTVPENITVSAEPNSCGAQVAFAASATGTPAPTITYKIDNYVYTSPLFFPKGTFTITATAHNGCGSVTKSFTVTVVDKTAPVPLVASLPDLTGECAVKITKAPEADDSCGGYGAFITATTTDPLEYTAQGTYTVTWTYRDAAGNAATQTQRVVVKDRTAPVPVLAVLPDATGECSVTATAPRATDNCAGSLTATTADPTTYAAQGTYVIRWRYDDGRGNVTEQPQTVVVKDMTAPVVTAPASLTLANDPGQCGRALASLSLGTPVASDGCGAVKLATHDAPAFFPAGTTTVTWTVEDAAGNQATATQRVTITNADPVLGVIAAPVSPVAIHAAVPASAAFRDDNLTEATWDWGNGTTAGTIDRANGKITGSRTYSTPGVHTVTLTVTDACGKTAASTFRYVVVYDPNGGFVTGGGSIQSPANAYAPDPAATGRAQFGFVSRYQKGATQPTGNTNFEFKGAGLEFNSTSYEWLVVSGPQAQFKGSGTLNGAPGYKFILTAGDGQATGGAGVDRLRIKIWKEGETVPVYDNQRGAADDAGAATAIGEGSILVHDDRSKAREGAEVRAGAPGAAATLNGFPNPFTGRTTIEFTLGREEAYSLAVYDLNGRLVAALGSARAEAGKVNRVVWEANTAPAGMYFARLTTRSGVQHLKLVRR